MHFLDDSDNIWIVKLQKYAIYGYSILLRAVQDVLPAFFLALRQYTLCLQS